MALAALTRSEAGSLILRGAETVEVAAVPTRVVDTTGAGDAYAAGFLAAYTAGRSLAACGRLGSIAAAEVIAHFGARPQRDLGGELAGAGGLTARAADGLPARNVTRNPRRGSPI